MIINQYQDLAVYGVLAILGIRLMGGYSMMLRFTSLLDVSRIAAGLFIATVLFGFYTGATTRLEFRYLVLLFYFSITVLVAYRVGIRLLYHRSIAVTEKTPTLLFGAGTNGLNAQRALMNSSSIQVLGFVDDDPPNFFRPVPLDGPAPHTSGQPINPKGFIYECRQQSRSRSERYGRG